MAQKSYHFSVPKRSITYFLKELTARQLEHTNKQIREIINQKKAKIKSLYDCRSHEVLQPSLIPTRKIYPEFMSVSPGSKGQEFISEKVKANVLTPDKFYSKEPNMKGGSISQPKKWSLPQDKLVLNKKFQEYNRIVDQQTGSVKHARLSEVLENYHTDRRQHKKYSRMKKTYFQKFIGDKYNFYKISSRKSICLDSSTYLKKSRSRVIETMDTRQNPAEIKRDLISMTSKEMKTLQFPEVKSERSKERIKTLSSRTRLKTIVNQKNMDSLN